MIVKSREEAWQQANKLFPTDYVKDEQSSASAGYPIYKSTASDVNAWISDLNVALELNIPDGKSIRINIQAEPEIKEERTWISDDVRSLCIRHKWYTAGNIKQYDKMLDFVAQNEPTALNIYKVAKDILEHTSDERCETVENIMFHLGKEVCITFFTVM